MANRSLFGSFTTIYRAQIITKHARSTLGTSIFSRKLPDAGTPKRTSNSASPRLYRRWLHWGTTASLFYGFVRNGGFTDPLNNPEAMQTEVLFDFVGSSVHLAICVHTLGKRGTSRLSATAPRWERMASHTVHFGTYLGIAAVILTGLAIALTSSTGGLPFCAALAAHSWAVHVTALIVIHIAGTLWHWLIRRDGVWQAMTG